ncbi:MAG: GNAT family N-acetyltransferase [Aminipila sp.]
MYLTSEIKIGGINILLKEGIEIRQAREYWEFELIYKLNYETFVEEIPQHHVNQNKTLVDRFDKENTYIIAIKNKEIIGMLALRDKRPFSLDQKISNLDSYLPVYRRICEVRLLSVRKQFRKTKVMYALIKKAFQYITLNEYEVLVISGILNQQKLYKHIGFIPFGDMVGNNDAKFQPMYITRDSFKLQNLLEEQKKVSLLPGPVEISANVKNAFSSSPLSHRSESFKTIFDDTKRMLCSLVKAKNVEIFTGSGTLANDVICLEIAKLNKKGLILSNGEFGNRLIEHGNCNALDFLSYGVPWGEAFNWEHINRIIVKEGIGWIYMVYSETSTGMINDFKKLLPVTEGNDVKICLDAISAIGNIPVDLSKVYLASCVSGKGLASFCGLSMVFYNQPIVEASFKLPRYLNLYQYSHSQGIPYTISSNLVFALHTALKNLNIEEKSYRIKKLYFFLVQRLTTLGVSMFAAQEDTNPAVLTIPIEQAYDSQKIGAYIRRKGYLVSFESNYLLQRNWIQICLMGDINKEQLDDLSRIYREAIGVN